MTFYDANRPPLEDHVASSQQMGLFIDFEHDCTSGPFRVGLDEAPFQELYYTRCSSVEQMVLHASR